MIPLTGTMFEHLSDEPQSQVSGCLPDDEFMRMMNMGSAYSNNTGRLEESRHVHTREESPPVPTREEYRHVHTREESPPVPTREESPHVHTRGLLCSRSANQMAANERQAEQSVSVNEMEGRSTQGTKRKRKTRNTRGQNKPKFGLRGPETVVFNQIGQAVAPSDKVSLLGRFCGQLVKECANFPLHAQNWGEIWKAGQVEQAWIVVENALDWSDPSTLALKAKIKAVIVEKLNDRWRSFKHKLKKKMV